MRLEINFGNIQNLQNVIVLQKLTLRGWREGFGMIKIQS